MDHDGILGRVTQARSARWHLDQAANLVGFLSEGDCSPPPTFAENPMDHLDEARRILDQLEDTSFGDDGERRVLAVMWADSVLIHGWLVGAGESAGNAAVILLNSALIPEGNQQADSSGPDTGHVWWDEHQAHDARADLVGLLGERYDAHQDAGDLDELIGHLEILVDAPLPSAETDTDVEDVQDALRDAADRRGGLGIALAERSRRPDNVLPGKDTDRRHAMTVLREALTSSWLDAAIVAAVRLDLAQVMYVDAVESQGDDARMDVTIAAEILDVLGPVTTDGDETDRAAAFSLGALVALLRCEAERTADFLAFVVAWLRRAIADPGLDPADLRDYRLDLATYLIERAEGEWPPADPSAPDQYPDPATDEAEALSLLEQLLEALREAGVTQPADRWDDEARLVALVGVVEFLSRTPIQELDADTLDRVISRCEELVGVIPADDTDRGEISVKLATVLFARALRRLTPLVNGLTDELIAHRLSGNVSAPPAALTQRAPDGVADLDRAAGLLHTGIGLCDPEGDAYWSATILFAMALLQQFLTRLPDVDRATVREAIRWLRVGLEAAPDGMASMVPDQRRTLVYALVWYIWTTEPFTVAGSAPGRLPDLPDPTGTASVMEDMHVVELLIEDDLAKSPEPEPLLAFVAGQLAYMQGRPDDFLRYLRIVGAVQSTEPEDLRIILFARLMLTLIELAPRVEEAPETGESAEAVGSDERLVSADALDVDLRAAVLIGDGTLYPFTAPVGRVLEVLDAEGPSAARQSGPGRELITTVLRAMALHRRWLRERDGQDLSAAVMLARRANEMTSAVPAGDLTPLAHRIAAFLAGLVLDRYVLLGDRVDLEAAHGGYVRLLAESDRVPSFPDLPVLVARCCDAGGLEGLRALLPDAAEEAATVDPPTDGAPYGHFRAEMLAALGEAKTLFPNAEAEAFGAANRLAEAENLLPAGHPRLPAVRSELGRIEARTAVQAGDAPALHAAIRKVIDAAAGCPTGSPHRPALLLRAAAVLSEHASTALGDEGFTTQPDVVTVHGATKSSPFDVGVALLEDGVRSPSLSYHGARARCRYGLGRMLHIRFLRTGDRAALDTAVEMLAAAWTGLEPSPGDPFAPALMRALAEAYRAYGPADIPNRRRAREAAARMLTSHREAVLLQSGTRRGLLAARLVDADMMLLVRWSLEDHEWEVAVQALERGRGLVLHAATVAATVPALLRTAGRADLAARWAEAGPQRDGSPQTDGSAPAEADLLGVPDDLRRLALEALEGRAAEGYLLSAPKLTDVGGALRRVGADALVHLVPGTAATPGYALVVTEQGGIQPIELPELRALSAPESRLAEYAAALNDLHRSELPASPIGAGDAENAIYAAAKDVHAAVNARWEASLERLCDWAGDVIQPVLDDVRSRAPGRTPRLVLAPAGSLGIVPWHAARLVSPAPALSRTDRRVCQEAVISYCATARQLVEAASRPPADPGGVQAMLVDPGGTWRMHLEARAIRTAFYPRSLVVGSMAWGEEDDGPWTGPPPLSASVASVLPLLPGRGATSAALLIANCHAAIGPTPAETHLLIDGRPGRTVAVTVRQLLADVHFRDPSAPGGLVVLVDCSSDLTLAQHDESLTLATALLATGFGAVVGARWPVDDGDRTTTLMFMFHHFLTGRGAPGVSEAAGSPADALRAAQCWMLDPAREWPDAIRGQDFAMESRADGFSSLRAWAAFTHHGR